MHIWTVTFQTFFSMQNCSLKLSSHTVILFVTSFFPCGHVVDLLPVLRCDHGVLVVYGCSDLGTYLLSEIQVILISNSMYVPRCCLRIRFYMDFDQIHFSVHF